MVRRLDRWEPEGAPIGQAPEGKVNPNIRASIARVFVQNAQLAVTQLTHPETLAPAPRGETRPEKREAKERQPKPAPPVSLNPVVNVLHKIAALLSRAPAVPGFERVTASVREVGTLISTTVDKLRVVGRTVAGPAPSADVAPKPEAMRPVQETIKKIVKTAAGHEIELDVADVMRTAPVVRAGGGVLGQVRPGALVPPAVPGPPGVAGLPGVGAPGVGGAGAGLAGAGAAGVLGTAGLAIGGLALAGIALYKFVDAIQDSTRGLLEHNLALGQFSPSMIAIGVQAQFRDIQRSIRTGEALAPSSKFLQENVSHMEDVMAENLMELRKIGNYVGGIAAKFLADTNWLKIILNGLHLGLGDAVDILKNLDAKAKKEVEFRQAFTIGMLNQAAEHDRRARANHDHKVEPIHLPRN